MTLSPPNGPSMPDAATAADVLVETGVAAGLLRDELQSEPKRPDPESSSGNTPDRPTSWSDSMQRCATLSEAARRWKVDRATARAAILRAGIPASDLYTSPRYSWAEILRKIEGWPADVSDQVNIEDHLEKADELADRLGVTPQTIRNYGRSGLFYRVDISARAIRYRSPFLAKNGSEERTADLHKK